MRQLWVEFGHGVAFVTLVHAGGGRVDDHRQRRLCLTTQGVQQAQPHVLLFGRREVPLQPVAAEPCHADLHVVGFRVHADVFDAVGFA